MSIKRNAKLLKEEVKEYKHHIRVWKFVRFLAKPFLFNKMGFRYDVAPKNLKAPYIVLSNHNSNFDSICLGVSFPQQMYFIASEQVYRAGFKSKLLKWAFNPISKIKGSSDMLAVAKAMRKLRNGQNVALFPEGNRSFNGKTWPINEATAKMVKVSGAGLVTYRLEGVYLSTPRWAKFTRKGKTYGRIVNYFTSEQVKEMSTEELLKIIQQDLTENAFEMQEKNPIKFIGPRKAEGMECAVCVCPLCNEIDAIQTANDTVFCKNCGKLTDYNDYGFFDESFPFKNITLWDEWQTKFYEERIANFKDENLPVFFDDEVKLSTITDDHTETLIGHGTFKMFMDRIEFLDLKIPLDEVGAISVFGKCVLCFTDKKGIHYELRPSDKEIFKNFRKYTSALQIIKGIVG